MAPCQYRAPGAVLAALVVSAWVASRTRQGALGARHCHQIDSFSNWPAQFFRFLALRECNFFAWRGKCLSRHKAGLSSLRSPALFIPRAHRCVSSLRSPLRFATPRKKMTLFTTANAKKLGRNSARNRSIWSSPNQTAPLQTGQDF